MNLAIIFHYIGHILRVEALFLVPGMLISLAKGERSAFFAFLTTIILLFACSFLLGLLRSGQKSIYAREGLAIVALSWIFISFFGALPFFLSGAIPNLIDALFETVSGFTTTGSSILTQVEAMPMGLLYWRSFTIWLGGMGVLVFFLAIASRASQKEGGSYFILQAESPGPIVGKLVPRMSHSTGILYRIYIVLTVLLLILLLAGGMPFFDALTTAFATAGTGGFSIRAASLAAYQSYYLQGVVAVFMVIFAVNFNLFYLLLLREFSKVFRDEELRLYLGIVAVSTLLVAWNTFPLYSHIYDALHHAFFQVSSIISTTGFATVDFALWPTFSKTLLLILMLLGGCAGSTGGGLKISRVLILWKAFRNGLLKQFSPRSVKVIRVSDKVLDDDVAKNVGVYMFIYAILTACSILLVSLDHFDLETCLSAVFTCINNVGPGLGAAGPAANFFGFSAFSKVVLTVDMLIGRLEIFPMLLLFSPTSWRRSR